MYIHILQLRHPFTNLNINFCDEVIPEISKRLTQNIVLNITQAYFCLFSVIQIS